MLDGDRCIRCQLSADRRLWPVCHAARLNETFVGGKESNKHASKRLHRGRVGVGKAVVMGIVERGGEVRAGGGDGYDDRHPSGDRPRERGERTKRLHR